VAEHPRTPLAWEVSAWAHFEKFNYSGGLNDLTQLIRSLPRGKLGDPERRALLLAGRLREFAASLPADRRPSAPAIEALDAAVLATDAESMRVFQQGRDAVRAVLSDFDRKTLATADVDEQRKLKFDRMALRYYVSYPLEAAAQQAIAGLDAE
jgi:hypothetical protein